MSDLLLKIFGIAVLGALVGVIMRKWSSDIAVLFKVAVGIVLAVACVLMVSPVIESIRSMAEATELGDVAVECVSVLVRVLCVAVLSYICSSVCRDCGETTAAYYAELGGKIEILLLSLPLFSEVMGLAVELLELGK